MAYDIWDYFREREKQCGQLSVSTKDLSFMEEQGSDGMRGQIWGAVDLTDKIWVSIREVCVIQDGRPHCEEYAYFLIKEGAEIWGYERDPSHDPAEHCHGRGHDRYAGESINFKEMLEVGWETVSRIEEEGDDIDPIGETHEPL